MSLSSHILYLIFIFGNCLLGKGDSVLTMNRKQKIANLKVKFRICKKKKLKFKYKKQYVPLFQVFEKNFICEKGSK